MATHGIWSKVRIRIRSVRDIAYSVTVGVVIAMAMAYGFGWLITPKALFAANTPYIWAIVLFIALPFMLFANIQLYWAQNSHVALRRDLGHDALTGVLNRSGFEQEYLRMAERGGVVVMLDLDHFKQVNDRYGHAAGDAVLVAVGEALMNSVRGSDHVARYGGEEFALLLSGISLDEAHEVVERLRHRIATMRLRHEGRRIGVTMSAGLTQIGPEEPVATVLRRADAALYRAKGAGRNRLMVQDVA